MDNIMTKKSETNRHYVNNKEFLAAMTEYRENRLAAEAKGKDKPRVTEYIGECFVKIANHLAYKSNFVNYTFREEMILDGIENCITYIDNFNPEKSKNPFAYFTQITYYAFLRRIQKEKKQLDTKYKYIQNLDLQSILDGEEGNGGSAEFVEYMKKQIDEAEKHNAQYAEQNKKIPKRRPKYLDDKEALKMAKEKIPELKDAEKST
tara:strand:+ start:241 stop:858 length:618 start_codon:yes stop_codon:yes gene_type:complete